MADDFYYRTGDAGELGQGQILEWAGVEKKKGRKNLVLSCKLLEPDGCMWERRGVIVCCMAH